MDTLKDKVAIVTGASRGIGRGIALRFAREGAKIVGFATSPKNLEKLSGEIRQAGGTCEVVAGSVAKSADVDRLVKTAVSKFGRIDILVNNAGIRPLKPFLELTGQDWDEVMDVNLKGMFLCSVAAGRVMAKQGGGRIINLASICSYQIAAHDLMVLYHISKGGIVTLTRAMAVALGPHNIVVNAIAPGWVYTDITKEDADGHEEEIFKRMVIKRLGQPEDMAELAVFLATEQTRYLTGQVILLDGGQSLLL